MTEGNYLHSVQKEAYFMFSKFGKDYAIKRTKFLIESYNNIINSDKDICNIIDYEILKLSNIIIELRKY
jgi:hypothetical protein